MGVIAKLPYIVQRITGGGTGPELRGTDIHGIGAMVNRLPTANQSLAGDNSSIERGSFLIYKLPSFLISSRRNGVSWYT